MVRNIHPSMSTKEVLDELEKRNFNILEVMQKLNRAITNNKVNYICLCYVMLIFDRCLLNTRYPVH